MSRSSIRAAQHMEGYLGPEIRAKRIKGALAVIKFNEKHHGEMFDAIAYRGASGAITASIIAHHLKKPLILVRKPEDIKGHSPYLLEGPTNVKRYLIVDDFMSSGSTYEAIREAVHKEHPRAECIGMLEVTYCESGGCDKRYRFSREHEVEIGRQVRVAGGIVTQEDVAWLSRNKPLSPKVVYRPVGIVKTVFSTGETKFRFHFENNQQKLLVADTTPKRDFTSIFSSLMDILSKRIDEPTIKIPIEKTTRCGALAELAKAEPEVDRVDIYRTTDATYNNPIFSNFFYDPIQYRVRLATSELLSTNYEQKTQEAPEAGVSAATTG